ncbi:xanthine dehydrogenase family protein subunit M [Rhodococcus sp. BP-252]|uniref:FAD binding domain-containing protein n=1 Tax=unclassified Rhodococcus (in: high G+C Gram-positive bacteria) TaxID=192944 RepID=UPI001C9B6E74|nr:MULTISPECIES: xanthine dehydrogenase family protein subunit M [unclassified Rhodococcus (in: high G+C Gram-positive bacteria)]MBY6411555.1 xanthine dehydrogenase family protein subunit M [Rhodococcus sp. BP-320]MBY6417937.1 xanthine dehydrogenase family protein subunit M [Rhodococcus sp. BP-321]MBY6422162.1 xanthine dehydrogenase family protein subunit M [Rhodococcus sp. BP-324]MBY6427735.1 xanthine dehydrogenase family protein subunit M [Rhodococcus sp. BP-323]MBY6433046.1 xanthine dehydro
MRTFAYDVATDVDDAIARLAADPGASLLGGGTNLVDLMKLGATQPSSLVDVSRLPLTEIGVADDGCLHVGAAVTNSDLAVHPVVRSRYPVLSRALLSGASGQLRNMATTGGNLFQRTRCVYFMDASKPCNKREPGSGCPAIEGEHRNLAILGASEHCVATHPSDMAVALTALDAVVVVAGPGGTRTVPIGELYRLPGDTPQKDTRIEHDEIVTGLRIPALPPGTMSMYRKVRDRASYAFALASVAAVLRVEDGQVTEARIALGGVAHKPWRAYTAEGDLLGRLARHEVFREAIDLELKAAHPLRDNTFKIPLVRNLVTEALTELTRREASV